LTINTISSGGNSGDVEINGFGDLLIDQTNILTAQQVEVKLCPNCSPISIALNDRGQAGNVAVTSTDSLRFSNSAIQSDTRGGNPAGNITITSPGIVSFNNSQIISNTSSTGKAGSISIEAGQGITLVGMENSSPVLSVETSSTGQPGSIIINTPTLTLSNNARITATATSTATNTEGGGSITLNASTMNLAGVVGVFAETQGQTPAGTLTLQPYQNQSTLNITLAPGSLVSASTSGSGKGGNLVVQAPEAINISGSGTLAVQSTGTGAAGSLTIDTKHLTIADGATISASTDSTNPQGTGGSININATESFNLTNQASLRAESTGAAPAGKVTINTPNLTATNGTIATSSQSSSGGDITITADKIRLYGDSDITTFVAQGTGGGGNIKLTADSILAFDDSDILAYAPRGTGGNITLLTPAFFGENYRLARKGTDPNTLDGNNRVDVNATGVVNGVITTPDVSFIENSLTELPSNQINTEQLLANSCIVRRNQPTRGSFFITGTDGLPKRPGDAQMSSFPTVDVETLPSDSTSSTTQPNRPWQKGDPIVEPQGVYRLPNGKLVMSRECSRLQ
jgi:large exoprotein involved in heme utilization and adhesion